MHVQGNYQALMVSDTVCQVCHLHTLWASSEGLVMAWQDFCSSQTAVHPTSQLYRFN